MVKIAILELISYNTKWLNIDNRFLTLEDFIMNMWVQTIEKKI